MAEKFKSRKILTPEFRVSFPRVFVPGKNMNDQDEYSLTMLFPKSTDITELKKLLAEARDAQWPDPKTRPTDLKFPIKDGDSVPYDGYAGHWAVRAGTRMKPGVVDANVQPIIGEDEFYGGCYARASVTAYAYTKGTKGVNLSLQNIQKLRDGEKFAGRTNPEEDFGPPTVPEANNPANYDDDIPF